MEKAGREFDSCKLKKCLQTLMQKGNVVSNILFCFIVMSVKYLLFKHWCYYNIEITSMPASWLIAHYYRVKQEHQSLEPLQIAGCSVFLFSELSKTGL